MILTAEQHAAARDEVLAILRFFAPPEHDCDACEGDMPGVLVDAGNDDNHLFLQSCDTCNSHDGASDDVGVTELAAKLTGWNVRWRWDTVDTVDESGRCFLAKPGGPDDFDCYGVYDDEEAGDPDSMMYAYGWSPDREVDLVPEPAR